MNSIPFRVLLALALLLVPFAHADRLPRTVEGKDCKILTDLPEDEAKAVAAQIDSFCEFYGAYFAELGLEARNNNEIVVRLFANFDEFAEYRDGLGMKSYLRMFWGESLNGVVVAYERNDPSFGPRLFGLCSNIFMRRYAASIPEWVRRGFEAYFHGYEVVPGSAPQKALSFVEAVVLRGELAKDAYIPVEDLTKADRKHFGERSDKLAKMPNLLPDAESWGLVHYFLELAPPPQKEMFRRYIKGLNAKGAKGEDARLQILDWAKFDREWKEAMLALDPKCDTGAKYLRVADAHMDVWSYSLAVPAYESAYKLDRTLPAIEYKLGYALKRAGDYETAAQWFDLAIKRDSTDPLPHHQLSRLYSAVESKIGHKPDPAKAVEHARQALELGGGKNPLYLAWLGRCQSVAGDKKAAVASVQKALQFADKDEKEKYEKLLKDVQKAK